VSDATQAPTDTVSITINGKELEATKGELLIDAAERHGVYIPRFCYHPRMRPVGMCRMCVVDIDAGRGPALMPACMQPVADGMIVDTESEATKKAQDGILEFLLINHPLDCPVCDKGGECPLQDQTMAYGPGESRFVEEKRHFRKPIAISDLIYLDRERCILCDRCTRFAKEVAGDPLIHFLERGNQTEVNTFPDHPFASYFSGNTAQICPVGALTAKNYRFRARPWDLDQIESTCQTCSVGCRMVIDGSRNRVLRYTAVDIDPVNWGWLCDKGRYNFEYVDSADRLGEPLVRVGDDLAPSTWAEALRTASAALKEGLDRSGPGGVAVIGGARLTNESAYAWAKLAKGVIGTDNVDAQLGDGLPAEVVLGLPRATIDDACAKRGTVLLLGPDPKEELPVLFLRLRHAIVEDGATLLELTPTETSLSDLAALSVRSRPGEVADVVRAALSGGDKAVGGVEVDDLRALGERLRQGPVTVVLGRPSVAEPADGVVAAAAALAELDGVRFLSGLRRGNVHGALDMGLAPGVLPGRIGLDDGRDWIGSSWATVPAARGMDTTAILEAAADGRIDTLILVGADPVGDFPDRDLAVRGLAGARTVIATDLFLTDSSRQADVVFPAAGYAECSGTTTNLEGRISTVAQKVTPPGTARADWMIAAELAFRLGGDLGVESGDDLWAEIERVAPSHRGITTSLLDSLAGGDGIVAPLAARDLGGELDTDRSVDGSVIPEGTGDDASGAAGEASKAEAAARADDGSDDSVELRAEANEAEADAVARSDEPGEEVREPSTGPLAPQLLRFRGADHEPPTAPVDAYSLRLVAARRLYDRGVLLQHSPTLAELAAGTVLRLNPYDYDRLGVAAGEQVKVSSARGSVTVGVIVDKGVPRGSAALLVNQPNASATDLIDATAAVTDVRVERAS
jgi:NADH-quinone oxidoreductase subunit G